MFHPLYNKQRKAGQSQVGILHCIRVIAGLSNLPCLTTYHTPQLLQTYMCYTIHQFYNTDKILALQDTMHWGYLEVIQPPCSYPTLCQAFSRVRLTVLPRKNWSLCNKKSVRPPTINQKPVCLFVKTHFPPAVGQLNFARQL